MISHMDRDVGRLFALLKELEIDDETIVFFTSDNGGYRLAEDFFQGNGGLRGGKGNFYVGGLRARCTGPVPVLGEAATKPGRPAALVGGSAVAKVEGDSQQAELAT